MYSTNAFEAYYTYIGLHLHEIFRKVLVSEQIFQGTILLLFGVTFFHVLVTYFSKYMPASFIQRKNIPLSKIFKVVGFLFLGLSILRIGSHARIFSYTDKSWHDNAYVEDKIKSIKPQYEVSFIFDILSSTSEELAALFSRIVDKTFSKTHSNLESPGFFYKAILYSSAQTISSPEIKEMLGHYTEKCLDSVLPLMSNEEAYSKLNSFMFSSSSAFDDKLDSIEIEPRNVGPISYTYSCLDLKEDLREAFFDYVNEKDSGFLMKIEEARKTWSFNLFSPTQFMNLHKSNLLINHFLDEKEAVWGVQKGSQLPTTGGRIFQYLNKIGWDSILSIFGQSELHGANVAAKRAQNFSDFLTRAPHLKGLIKLFLIAAFPFLIFPIVLGKWKWLAYWVATYLSVLMWTPIWTLLYHLMTNIELSASLMKEFGEFYDGISFYSAKVISSRAYYMYAVFSWIQLALGPIFTIFMLKFLHNSLSDTEEDTAPEFVDTGKNLAQKGVQIAGVIA